MSFRDQQPLAWAYHRNTSRWTFNVLQTDESVEHQLAPKEYPDALYQPLPAPRLPALSLERAIQGRLSCRRFAEQDIGLAALGDVLYAGAGVLGTIELGSLELPLRPTPSGGSLYPLELYVLARAVKGLEIGVHHYAAVTHGLEEVRRIPLPGTYLGHLFMGQHYVGSSSAVVVLTAVVHRSLHKYGDRGYRYVLLEAGHVGQNINLAAPALGLGALDLGGFLDDELAELLDLDGDLEIPLYAVALGAPDAYDPVALRVPQ